MLRYLIIICLISAILLPAYLLTAAIDEKPLVSVRQPPDAKDAKKVKDLAKRAIKILYQKGSSTLTVDQEDLNAAIAFLDRGTDRLSGHARISDAELVGVISLRIPNTPFGSYVNLTFTILPSIQGVNFAKVEIGKLRIPGSAFMSSAVFLADRLLGDQLGSTGLESIERLSFSDHKLNVTFVSGAQLVILKERLRSRVKDLHNSYAEVGDKEAIRFYFQQLHEMGVLNTGKEPISLTRFMAPLFKVAEIRSQKGDPVAENHAALFALSLYLGSHHFHKFTGEMHDSEKYLPKTSTRNVVLDGRQDLRLHFLVSAGLSLLSDSQLGFAVGEFKELLDANRGGSGFSFVDLAADRAGLAFAESATQSRESARRFQRIMAKTSSEATYFLSFQDLEEGIDALQFQEKYGNIDSQHYAAMVKDIDQRLKTLPLYQ
jgi:hypothetical protein